MHVIDNLCSKHVGGDIRFLATLNNHHTCILQPLRGRERTKKPKENPNKKQNNRKRDAEVEQQSRKY